jgi:catechol 2,3-dioxygenase-like lactoylglutathione lyase family enzyme
MADFEAYHREKDRTMSTIESEPVSTADKLHNINPKVGIRFTKKDNALGLVGMDHFALPVRDVARMERFVREVLGGEAYYYAGFDDTDKKMGRKPHIFMRIGEVLFQCTEECGPSYPRSEDNDISPHWAFGTTAAGMRKTLAVLKQQNIPTFGPVGHRDIDIVSFYFKSPEGHKLEVCTWEPYPDSLGMMGAPEIGFIDWPALNHNWTKKV